MKWSCSGWHICLVWSKLSELRSSKDTLRSARYPTSLCKTFSKEWFIHLPHAEHLNGLPSLLTAGHLLPLLWVMCSATCSLLAGDIKTKTKHLISLTGGEINCKIAARKQQLSGTLRITCDCIIYVASCWEMSAIYVKAIKWIEANEWGTFSRWQKQLK